MAWFTPKRFTHNPISSHRVTLPLDILITVVSKLINDTVARYNYLFFSLKLITACFLVNQF